jgi:transcriptional regulator with XRE-family HTH domain
LLGVCNCKQAGRFVIVANMNSIGDYIKQQREQAKISLRQLAEQAGVSNPYLSQIERGLRKPSADILQQIAKGLRISAEALYVQAGILEDHPGDSGVRSALLTDPQLTERQKQVLIEIYESFRRESQKPTTAEVVAVVRDRPAPEGEAPTAAAGEVPSAPAGEAPSAPAGEAPSAPAGEAAPGPAGDDEAPPTGAGEWADATDPV